MARLSASRFAIDLKSLRRVAHALAIAMSCLAICSGAAGDDRLDAVLSDWVAAAQDIERPSLTTAAARYGEELSAHQLEAAIFLWAPDSVDSLTSRFDWTIESVRRDGARLVGVPGDNVDRVFVGTVEVDWDAEAQRPLSLRFQGSRIRVQFATIHHDTGSIVRQAAFYPPVPPDGEGVPPEPGDVRTAAAVFTEESQTGEAPSVDGEVAMLLQRWAAVSSEAEAWELRLNASDVNHVFVSEQQYFVMMRGDGQGTIEICWDPRVVEPDEINHDRTAPDGTPYRLQSGPATAWVFTPEVAIFANTAAQTVRRLDLASFDQFPWYKHPLHTPSCMTLFLPVAAEDLQSHYLWQVASRGERTTSLRGVPLIHEVAESISLVEVDLNSATGSLERVRCVDASGSHEQEMQVIERVAPVGLTAAIILEGYANFAPAPEKPRPAEAR